MEEAQAEASGEKYIPSQTDSALIWDKTITLTALFENLEQVRDFIAEAAVVCECTPRAVYEAQLAVDEAFTNIVEHAYGGECQELVQCTCQVDREGLVILLKDCGQPFEPKHVPEPDLDADLQTRPVGGLGLFFMRKLMDEVEFTFTQDPDTGRLCNLVRMVKRKQTLI